MNIFMLMMGGSGTRFGADRPKQYIEIDGQPIFSYILEKCSRFSCIDKIVVVSNADWLGHVEEWIQKLHIPKCENIVAGGETRSESVKNGLLAMQPFAGEDDVILIHDATHPYVEEGDIEKIIAAVREYGAATLGQPQYDTVYQTNSRGFLEKVIPREFVVSGASPEAFRYGIISEIYFQSSKERLARMTSAGAIALDTGIEMKIIPMTGINLKITYSQDMELFRQLVHTYFFK